MNSKNIGELTEATILLEFLKQNISVSLPWGDNQSYDMIIDYKNKLYKIQCKTGRLSDDDTFLMIPFRSTHSNKNQTYTKYYSEKNVDFFATYHNNKVYLVPVSCVQKTAIHLRLLPCKNNQVKSINWAKDYELDAQLNILNNDKED